MTLTNNSKYYIYKLSYNNDYFKNKYYYIISTEQNIKIFISEFENKTRFYNEEFNKFNIYKYIIKLHGIENFKISLYKIYNIEIENYKITHRILSKDILYYSDSFNKKINSRNNIKYI